jgi:hypothetical protein
MMCINHFFYSIANKTRNLLFAISTLTYLHNYTIIGFVGFVVNLLNRPTDGATVQRPKKNYFSSSFENVKLPFSLRAPKKSIKKFVSNNTYFICRKRIRSFQIGNSFL